MPKDFYRSRLDLPMNEKVLNFLSSLEDDLWIVEEDITGTQAHDIMLYEQGILAGEEIKKILISLEKIRKKITNHKLKLDHNFEDIHPFIEKLVIDDIGIEIGGKIHTGRSRNDQISVDLRLKIRDELNKTSEKLIELINVLFKRSEETINAFMPLYTHLQGGQLGVFAHYLNNYV
ncbi:MAG: argininosuccinate lyase, partial [Promethearchaeota archaeon]